MILSSVKDLIFTPRRIISLVPSQTELLHYLNLDDATVAITKFCVHPKHWLSSKQIIGGTKNVNLTKVCSLQPDLIIASKEENVKEQVEELAKDFNVWLTDVKDFTTALQMITDLGSLTGTGDKAQTLVQQIEQEFLTLLPKKNPKAVAYLIWQDPFITVGGDTFINDMLGRCGLENIFADTNRYPSTTIGEIKDRGCQVLLLSSEPYPFEQKHIAAIQALLPASKIILANGEFFSWYGSRLLQAPSYFNSLVAAIS